MEYAVLDVESISSEVNVGGSKYVSDLGKNDTMFIVRTRLGHLFNVGDYALGFDLDVNDMELDKCTGLVIPQVILVKKRYEGKKAKKVSFLEA